MLTVLDWISVLPNSYANTLIRRAGLWDIIKFKRDHEGWDPMMSLEPL